MNSVLKNVILTIVTEIRRNICFENFQSGEKSTSVEYYVLVSYQGYPGLLIRA